MKQFFAYPCRDLARCMDCSPNDLSRGEIADIGKFFCSGCPDCVVLDVSYDDFVKEGD